VRIPKTTAQRPNFSTKSGTTTRVINPSRRVASRYSKPLVSASIAVALLTISFSAGAASHSARLSPAPNLPVGHACTHALVHDADGNVTPLLCSPTRFNVEAWRWYARNSPVPMLALPRDATLSDVEGALCRVQSSTAAMRYSEYQLARAYNDWRFSPNPITLWETKGCG
jgi:hypothetical protein